MASFTLKAGPFPEGTSVGAYPASRWPSGHPSGAPIGAASESKTVSGGALTFTTLADGRYYAAADIGGGVYRYVQFMVGQDIDPSDDVVNMTTAQTISGVKTFSAAPVLAAGTVKTADIQDAAVTAAKVSADVATQAELDAHEADTTAVHGIANTAALVVTTDSRLSDERVPTALSVTTGKIQDAAVTAAKVSADVVIAPGDSVVGVAAFATDRQPSTTRPVLVAAVVQINCPRQASGSISARVGSAPTPTQNVAQAYGNLIDPDIANERTVEVRQTLTFLVPAGHYYRLVTTVGGGSPAFTLNQCREWAL